MDACEGGLLAPMCHLVARAPCQTSISNASNHAIGISVKKQANIGGKICLKKS